MKTKIRKTIIVVLIAVCCGVCLALGMANMRNISEDSVPEDAVVDSESGMETYTIYNGEKDWEVEYVDGRYLISAYYGSSKTPTVPYIEVNEDYYVTGLGDGVFKNSNITSITLNWSITSIGKECFYGCTSLKTISDADYITSIGSYAFYNCESLTSAPLCSGLKSIESNTFRGCSSLTSISIPGTVTSIGSSAFLKCSSLTSVVIPNSVTSIGKYAFGDCTNATEVTIGTGVKSIGDEAFAGMKSVKTLYFNAADVDNDDFSKTNLIFDSFGTLTGCDLTVIIGKEVTHIPPYFFPYRSANNSYAVPCIHYLEFESDSCCTKIGNYAFYHSSYLETITIPESMTSIGYMAFYWCLDLKNIYFNAINCSIGSDVTFDVNGNSVAVTFGPNVQKIPRHLFFYLGTTEVTIPASVIIIEEKAFYCSSVTSITFENTIGWSASNGSRTKEFKSSDLEDPSAAAKYLCSTYVEYEWERIYGVIYTLSSDGTYYIASNYNEENEKEVEILSYYKDLPVKEIAASLFESHTEITSVTIPEGITTIDEYAFYKCTGLTSVTIPDSVTAIGEYAFDGCTGLTSLTIGEGVTTIGAYAFRCKYLTKINFNAVKMDDLSSKNQVFYNAGDSGSGIAVTIGANVTKIPAYLFFPYSTSVTAYTPSYTSVEFMSGSKCTSIGKYAFYSCSYLKSIEIPDSVTSIGNYAFSGCSGLTSLTIGTGVTSIGNYAFRSCSKLASVEIPASVSSIGTYAFYKCSSLTSVTFKNTEGWSCSYSITTIDMDSSDLTNTSTAATYLTSTYYTYTWTRTEGAGFTYHLSSDGSYYILDSYVGRSTNVTVEGTHNGLPVKEIGPYAFEGNTRMMTVVISENVTAIGEGAFYCCSLLLSVDFPSTLVTIGDLAFAGCTLLLGVEFPSGLVSIGKGAFLECVCLMAVVFSSGLESIGEYAFAGTYLIQLYVDDLASFLATDFADSFANPLSVLSENGGTFYVGGLETTKLTAINTAGVTRIGSYALAYCTIITDVALGEDVAYIGAHAFEGMSGLKSFTLSYYSGWTVYASSTLSSGTKITSDELEEYALTYFTSTYVSYVWRWAYVSNAAPVVECREVANGGYINCSFTVMVSVDASSSVWYIAYTDPTGATFTSYYDATWTITPAVNGTYEFVAVDTDGFVSETYYIIFDDTAPDLYLGGAAAWANYNSSEFSVLAVDNLDENVRLYYSLDGENGEWILCGSNPYTVTPDSKASTDGYWWFKAVDAAGNSTPAYRTVLDTVAVFGSWEFYDDMSLYFSYSAPSYTSWTCYVNGVEYSSGSPFSKDQTTYTAVLTSPNGSTLTAEKFLDHYFPEDGEIVDPTCRSMGYTIYTCVYCGETQLGNFLSACDHEYMEVTVEATCTTNGYSRAECIYCGGVKEGSYTPIYASGHSPVSGAYLAPTCTEPGYYGTVCEVCGAEIETTPIEALGHLLMTETVPSTCVSYGYSLTYCTRDGCDYSVRNGLSGTDAYLTDHVYGDVLRVSATCTDDGYTYEKCTVCGYEHTTVLHATGHDFGQYYEAEDTETGIVTRWHTCRTCGFTESFELSNNADTAANGVIDIFQKYQKYMWWILLAFVGIWSLFIGLRYALSRNDEEKVKAKSMLANYILGIFVIAIVLVGLPYLIYGIAILVG